MKILVACEESQILCKVFRKLGHEAFSCDILECSGGHPEWHIKDDVLNHLEYGWDMMIAFPPCTYLTITGNKWFNDKYKTRFPDRLEQRQKAIEFFLKLYNAKIEKIAIENPVGIISTELRKPDQIIQPYQFGHETTKKTCLWLKNLPKLKSTNLVEPKFIVHKSGKKDPIWHYESIKMKKLERSKYRSKTFKGIAEAMAEQWG